MKRYKIFKHPLGKIEAVKQGWSWPGFFFSTIWAMVKKMWIIGLGTLIGLFIIGLIITAAKNGHSGGVFINIIAGITNIIFGANGNSWREKNLRSRGFTQVGIIASATPEGAIALYLKSKNL